MSKQMTALIEAMNRIAIALEASALPPGVEGFRDYPDTVYANVNKGNGDGWYTLKEGKPFTQQPILRARVVDLRLKTVKRREQDTVKLHLFVRVDGEVIKIEAGPNRFFGKTVLAALASASPETLTQRIQLATYIKELRTGDKTLAVSIRDARGNQLSSEWTNEDDWDAITQQAIANVKAAAS